LPSFSSAKVSDEVISEKKPAEGVAAGIVLFIDNLLFGLRERVRAKAAQALKIMAVSSQCGIADQSVGDRVVGLEPLDFEKEQQITNLRRALLDALLQVLIVGICRVRSVKQPGVAADTAQGFVDDFQFPDCVEQDISHESFRMLHQGAKSSRKGFSVSVTVVQCCLDPRVVMGGKEIVQVPANAFCAASRHDSSRYALLYKPSLWVPSKGCWLSSCDFLDSACMMLEFIFKK